MVGWLVGFPPTRRSSKRPRGKYGEFGERGSRVRPRTWESTARKRFNVDTTFRLTRLLRSRSIRRRAGLGRRLQHGLAGRRNGATRSNDEAGHEDSAACGARPGNRWPFKVRTACARLLQACVPFPRCGRPCLTRSRDARAGPCE
eukprot:scaffold3283_cov237-Pinguiococcus_pyrenoidosus.AAC.7